MRTSVSLLALAGLTACAAIPARAGAATVIPEPASLPLLILAAAGLVVGRRLSR